MDRKAKYRLQYFISLAISLLLLGLVIHFVDFSRFLSVIFSINIAVLILLLVLSAVVNVGVYCHRWRYMLKWLGYSHSLKELVRVHLGTGVLHLFMPVQTGEAVTAYALAGKNKGPVALYFGTVAYGKYINLIATVLLLLFGLFLSPDTPLPKMGIAIVAFLLVMFVGLSLEFSLVRQWVIQLASIFGKKPGQMVRELFSVFSDYSPGQKIFLLLYSVGFKFSEIMTCFILFRFMEIPIPFGTHMAICGVMILIGNLPVTIAGAGTREALALILLAAYTDDTTAVAAGLLYTFIEYIWPMIIGLPWMRPVISEYLLVSNKTD